ncbi:class I SAM-dependent methyltransferase [Tsukamurella sp. 1534]|uniref:class I SAM-dependent methyltransferase n=1 Tax=Tsukamurella sp. 1534 TaxID=1151061 RepID=UPI00031DE6A4|nr:class I SAM-dependent methyltransferase [Tsukamurella sp. 1534]
MTTGSARTDGDTWDIATSVGFTALLVAAARALENDRADALARDPYARVLVEAAGEPRAIAMLDTPADGSTPMSAMSASRHLGVRTRFFDDHVRDAVAAGVRQVVILASGLDSRAYRLDLPGDVDVYELDQPAVLAFKRETLSARGIRPAAGLHAVPVDLREDWPAALRSAGFDGAAPSAWLVEGLLPYLPAQAQVLLFERIVELAAPGSRVAVEGQTGPLDLEGFRALADRYSSSPDDPLGEFDVTALFAEDQGREDPAEYLAREDWSITRSGSPIDLGRAYGVETVVPEGTAHLNAAIGYFTATLPG